MSTDERSMRDRSLAGEHYTADDQLDVASLTIGDDVWLGDNVWLGGGVVVCPGVTIGHDTVGGAGSVVTCVIRER